jgi:hypothetical protein
MSSKPWNRRAQIALIAGDVIAYAVITLIGFASHRELAGPALARMLATFVPFTAAWLLVAPWLGVYRQDIARTPRDLWRPALAASLSAPLGAYLRGTWLVAPILPLFVTVMAGVSALVILVWRAAFALVSRGSAATPSLPRHEP